MMTVARGLFRLWIVASVVWVCAVGAVAWSKLSLKDEWAEFKPTKPVFDPSKPYEVVPDWARDTPVDDAERKTFILHAADAALIPPVLVLVLGAALGWVAKGFRANEPRK